MNQIFLLSVFLKGIGAVLEILIQIVITRSIGVSGYGTYSTWISASELIFWCLFSGMVKCNTFYLAEPNTNITSYKKKYYLFYVLPVLCGSGIVAIFTHKSYVCLILGITAAYLLVQDSSSTFMARKYSARALFGEYVLGRWLLLIGVVLLVKLNLMSLMILVGVYLIQFLLVEVYFQIQRQKKDDYPEERRVSLAKWGRYQRADIVQAMIGQAPVILQYFFTGAFEAGVVSVVLLVKKLINFISGPTAKIFLPEFSRLYKEEDVDGIRNCFSSIMRIQMLFVGPMAVVLIGYPKVILHILSDELVPYYGLLIMCAVIFLIAASLGPCGGVMQMTGNERKDNFFREIAVGLMIIVFVLFRHNTYFVLFGLCTQTATESIGKYIFVCRWMKKSPTSIQKYLKWWLLPIILIIGTYLLKVQDSFLFMVIFALIVFCVKLYIEVKKEGLLRFIKDRK